MRLAAAFALVEPWGEFPGFPRGMEESIDGSGITGVP